MCSSFHPWQLGCCSLAGSHNNLLGWWNYMGCIAPMEKAAIISSKLNFDLPLHVAHTSNETWWVHVGFSDWSVRKHFEEIWVSLHIDSSKPCLKFCILSYLLFESENGQWCQMYKCLTVQPVRMCLLEVSGVQNRPSLQLRAKDILSIRSSNKFKEHFNQQECTRLQAFKLW